MFDKAKQEELVRIAMEEAEKAIQRGDDPFGGVIVDREGKILVREGNRENTENNPSSHAEMVAIREACRILGKKDLSGYISVCNAESCPMCMSALIMAGIREFYFGTSMESFCNPYLRMQEVADRAQEKVMLHPGILYDECTEQVQRGRRIRNGK